MSLHSDLFAALQRLRDLAERSGHFDRVEAERMEQEQQDRENARAARVDRLRARGVPREHAVRLVAGVEDTPILSVAKRWLAASRRVLVLSGRPGCGKTLAAAWCVANAGSNARFVHSRQLMRVSPYDDNAMGTFERCVLLAVDDLGTEYADTKGMSSVVLDAIVDARHSELLPTVITTNLNGERFRARYGERVFDRVRDGRFYQCTQQTLRGGRSS